ncbi:cytochrome P450 [Streptomyces sp. LMG1-1-1.1]|uniref:cytochrome P450 n=1 Tax=Streptomyces sp. LMG1-1-1.1 TaxID=3135245 RepID=UPI0034675A14
MTQTLLHQILDYANRADPLAESDSEESALPPSFLRLDPPEHDRLRRMTNRHFGPPHSPHRVDGMRPELADTLAASLDPDPDADPAERGKGAHEARMQLGMYLAGLIEERRKNPGDDMLSQLATAKGQDGPMTTMELLSTAALLLIAGHETTVNLITNGMLTLLRNPDVLRRLRTEPRLAVPIVEELLRFEPPVQLLPQRTTLADIEVRGVTIPKGSTLWLLLASGNRDPPQRFENPDRFDPDRPDVQHLGLGSGIHSCFGAPLARLEAQLALSELARRLENPRLLDDPPPYRQNAVLRGPRQLGIACDGIRP